MLPHTDVLFPVAYCLAVGGLCHATAGLLPFWLLLVLLPPSFAAGLHFIVLKGAWAGRPPMLHMCCPLRS